MGSVNSSAACCTASHCELGFNSEVQAVTVTSHSVFGLPVDEVHAEVQNMQGVRAIKVGKAAPQVCTGDGGAELPTKTMEEDMEEAMARLSAPTKTSTGSAQSHPKGRSFTKSRSGLLRAANPVVGQIISFEDRAALRRGTRLSAVMRRGAAIFATPEGSAETYKLSEPVEKIDVFISHNWCVSRAVKFFCLAFYFSFHQAFAGAFAVTVAIGVATARGALPLVELNDGQSASGICGTLMVTPIFLLVVFYGHDLRWLVGCRNIKVFLDKTCIHQTDVAVQEEGIRKLGAFVGCSSRFVVVYSDLYLQKLWTVYEMACFLLLHPAERMAVVPPYIPLFVLGGIVGMYLSRLCVVLLQMISSLEYGYDLTKLEAGSILLMATVVAMLFRHMARMMEAARRRLAHFKLSDTRCSVEADRLVVHRNIAHLMRAVQEVDENASDDDALEAFEQIVRERLAGPLVISAGLQYQHCCALFMCGLFPAYLDLYMGRPPQPEELWTRVRICYMLDLCSWPIGVIPLLALLVAGWVERCLHLSGWREGAFIALGSTLIAVAAISIRLTLTHLFHKAVEHGEDSGIIGLAIFLVASVLVANAAFALKYQLSKKKGADI